MDINKIALQWRFWDWYDRSHHVGASLPLLYAQAFWFIRRLIARPSIGQRPDLIRKRG